MKKVVLVDPVYNPGIMPPSIPLGKIEAALEKEGVPLQVVDFVSKNTHLNLASFLYDEDEFVSSTIEAGKDADAVYITSSTGLELKPYPIFPRIRRITKSLKENTAATIIVGGAFTNYLQQVLSIPPEIIRGSSIDTLITGDELGALDRLAGISKGDAAATDISIAWNSWDMTKYPALASILTTVGCPYKCDFCFEGKTYDPKNKSYSAQDAMTTVRTIRRKYGISRFAIEDSTILANAEFKQICDSMREVDSSFTAYARINEILKSPERVNELKYAGCSSLIVGIETPDDMMLRKMKKGIKLENIMNAMDILHQADVQVQACFMVGLFGDGYSETERTIDFARELNLLGCRWHIYQPNLQTVNSQLMGKVRIDPISHLDVQVNLPDCCLAEVIDSAPPNILLDEHFLIRALPYLQEHPRLAHIGYRKDFMFDKLYALLRSKLLPMQNCFNEEEMYRLI